MANRALYGFMSLADVFGRRVSDVGADVVNRAIQATVDEHNRQLSAMMGLFAQPTTQYSARYKTATAARLQPSDELGRARPIRPSGYYDLAWPIQMGLASWGADFISEVKMTVEEANEATAALISADVRWMRDHMLAALFAAASWTFEDPDKGDLTVKGLANGDTDTYLILAGADAPTTDTHLLAQAAAIADGANPYPTIYDELMEHPENSGEVVAFIPTNLRATTMALTNFFELNDPNLTGGTNQRLAGSLGVSVPGSVIGYVDKVWVVEWRALPDSYIIATTTDGESSLRMRQDPEPELQGFRLVNRYNEHPFYRSEWMRRAGFGANNRVGSVAYRIGNANYAAPTNYSSPMA